MLYIQEVIGREVLESRGLPTIEVEIILSDGQRVSASSPSGTSYGSDEAVEVRDKDMSRYHGFGVTRAVNNVNKTIAPRLYKKDPLEQFDIDDLLADLDGTPNKAHLGVNTILATSMAVAKAGALILKQPLFEYLHFLYKKQYNHIFKEDEDLSLSQIEGIAPMRAMKMPEPIFNMVNGRESETSRLDFQDFMVIFKGITEFNDKIRYASEIDHQIQKNLAGKDYYYTSLSNEGGFTPDLETDQKAIEIINDAISTLEPKIKPLTYYGLDIAATGIYNNTKKVYRINDQNTHQKKEVSSEEMIDYLLDFSQQYPIIFFEDGLAANDFKGWKSFMEKVPTHIGVVGDDLYNCNKERIERGKKEHWANAIAIKPNQIGSVLDIMDIIIQSQQQNMKIVISHRSGETNDDYLADLAVAVGAEYLKAGAPHRGERVAKYNRLLRIQEDLDIIIKTSNS